jgi:hypothetical protein
MRLARLLLACPIVLGALPAAAQQNLGRLFLQPQQRQELDRRRQANIQEAAAVTENLVTINGQVSRSSGRTTVWVNGIPQDGTRKPNDPARVALPGGEGQPSVNLKIGQTLDKVRGEVRDPVGAGKILTPAQRREPRQ